MRRKPEDRERNLGTSKRAGQCRSGLLLGELLPSLSLSVLARKMEI